MDFEALKKQHGEDAVKEAFMLGVIQGLKQAQEWQLGVVQGLKQAQEWRPIETAPLNKRILAAMEGDVPEICKLSLSPEGILVAKLDCGLRYNAKSIYEVYMELPKP